MKLRGWARKAVETGIRQGLDYAEKKLDESSGTGSSGTRSSSHPRSSANSTSKLFTRVARGLLAGSSNTQQTPPSAPAPQQGHPGPASAEVRGGFDSARGHARSGPKQGFPHRPAAGYPGDFVGEFTERYSPDLDGEADPGEIVWGWVPFEEDPKQGKDRPVLIIGTDGPWLLGLMLTSKDHIPGNPGEVRSTHNASYINIGAGPWDTKHRPSEIRLDRIIRIDPAAVRREGAIMPMDAFATVVAAVRSV